MANDKRARKKDHRDAVLAQRQALLRRRRAARLGAVLTVIVLIVGAALITAGGEDGGSDAGSQPDPTAAPVESTDPQESAEPAVPDAVACGAEAPPAASSKRYDAAEQVLEDGVDYRAVIETSCGPIEMDLLEDKAPVTVNNFVFLAQEGFYDGVTFHRVEPAFVIQGGDPEGTGAGGPGYEFEDELWAPAKKYVYGTVSMANAGPNTNGSQFFVIVHEPKNQQAGLAPAYSMFGVVETSSYPTLEKIKKVETNGSTPVSAVYIESVEIVEG